MLQTGVDRLVELSASKIVAKKQQSDTISNNMSHMIPLEDLQRYQSSVVNLFMYKTIL